MKKGLRVIIWFLCLAVSGCVAGKTPLLPGIGGPDIVSTYRERTISFEKTGDVQQALFCWQVISALTPEDKEAREKIAGLKELARQKGDEHYKKASDLAKKGDWDNADLQAVIALRYDPNRSDALELLSKERDMIRHKVQSGETLVSIAEKYFNDPEKAQVIAYFNDLPKNAGPLSPGMLLEFPHMPVVENMKPPETPIPETASLLTAARKEFKQKKYRDAAILAEKIIELKPDEQDAITLRNNSYLAMGSEYLGKQEYKQAEAVLVLIDQGFPGLKEALAELERWKKERAEEHYRQGVKYYLNEDLTKAIMEWKQSLELYPGHTRARENIDKARAIEEKLKTVK